MGDDTTADIVRLLAAVALFVLFAAIGYVMGEKKNRAWPGMWLGLLLGPIGLLVLALLSPQRRN